ncbi:hypothetical protein GYH30_055559 [Glycine max]|nr:hypothetical protein GYH30_055559 [Glycine max]
MSSGFILAVIGAPLKLFIVYVSVFFFLTRFVFYCCCMLHCILNHNTVNPSVSMRLRPKRFVWCAFFCVLYFFGFIFMGFGSVFFSRTCCGVECFGGFHIQRFSYLFIFLRGDFT